MNKKLVDKMKTLYPNAITITVDLKYTKLADKFARRIEKAHENTKNSKLNFK